MTTTLKLDWDQERLAAVLKALGKPGEDPHAVGKPWIYDDLAEYVCDGPVTIKLSWDTPTLLGVTGHLTSIMERRVVEGNDREADLLRDAAQSILDYVTASLKAERSTLAGEQES